MCRERSRAVRRTPAYPFLFFFFNDTATTEIYTLSLHDALPIFHALARKCAQATSHSRNDTAGPDRSDGGHSFIFRRSEEHTSELQSQSNLVCRLLLEKKKEIRRPHSRRCGQRAMFVRRLRPATT